jgi:DNA-binding NarL/FixJ family response regulator
MDELHKRKSDGKLRLVLVEDHKLSRIGLQMVLNSDSALEVVGESESGQQGIQLVQELDPDLVLLDLGLPDVDGLQVTRAIRQFNTRAKILILTSHDTEDGVLNALSAGADAYCLKDILSGNLVEVIKYVWTDGLWLDPRVASLALHVFSKRLDEYHPQTHNNRLTSREREVLRLIAEGMQIPEIARAMGISPPDAEAHVENIQHKLSSTDHPHISVA